jgi:hypothetical protein
LLKNRSQLLVEKKEEPKKDEGKKEDKPAASIIEAPKSAVAGASGAK